MTKEEIKALIATAIAGQGTNVDGGGQLPNILNAIVDAIPEGGGVLQINGLYEDGDFTPDAGQPTKAEAIAAFNDGITVRVRAENADEEISFVDITSYDSTNGVLRGIGFSWE